MEEVEGVKCYRPSPGSPVAFVVFPSGQVVQSMNVKRSLLDDVRQLGLEGAYNRLVRLYNRSWKEEGPPKLRPYPALLVPEE